MKKWITMLVMAVFAAVSMPVVAQDYGDKPKAEKKSKKAKKSKKTAYVSNVKVMNLWVIRKLEPRKSR